MRELILGVDWRPRVKMERSVTSWWRHQCKNSWGETKTELKDQYLGRTRTVETI